LGRPIGITILGILYLLGGIGWIILAFTFGVISAGLSSSMFSGFAGLGAAIAGIALIAAIIEFVIAGALLSGKSGGRIIVIIFSIIDLMVQAVSVLGGNIFGIMFVILDLIVLYYMWRPHVIAYFKGGYGSGSSGGPSGIFYCKHCHYAAESYVDLRNHLTAHHKQTKEKETKSDDGKNIGILKERLAKGEITKEEYDDLKKEFE